MLLNNDEFRTVSQDIMLQIYDIQLDIALDLQVHLYGLNYL